VGIGVLVYVMISVVCKMLFTRIYNRLMEYDRELLDAKKYKVLHCHTFDSDSSIHKIKCRMLKNDIDHEIERLKGLLDSKNITVEFHCDPKRVLGLHAQSVIYIKLPRKKAIAYSVQTCSALPTRTHSSSFIHRAIAQVFPVD